MEYNSIVNIRKIRFILIQYFSYLRAKFTTRFQINN